jgi:hypothetical protein
MTISQHIQRKGESWEEKYGYGTGSFERKRRGLTGILNSAGKPNPKRNYNISNPEDFRQVSAIIDVDIVPETYRRVKNVPSTSTRHNKAGLGSPMQTRQRSTTRLLHPHWHGGPLDRAGSNEGGWDLH